MPGRMDLDFGDTACCSDGLLIVILTRALTASYFLSFIHLFRQINQCKETGEVGSDPRTATGYFFQRSSVPPRSPLHYQLENGGGVQKLPVKKQSKSWPCASKKVLAWAKPCAPPPAITTYHNPSPGSAYHTHSRSDACMDPVVISGGDILW